jgi:integrase
VRFTWRGKELRPTINLKPTAANLKHARRQRQDILDEIAVGIFDVQRHFPHYKFADKHAAPTDDIGSRTFAEWADRWAKVAARELERSTIKIYRTHLAAYWTSVWGHLLPRRITHEMVLSRMADLAVC